MRWSWRLAAVLVTLWSVEYPVRALNIATEDQPAQFDDDLLAVPALQCEMEASGPICLGGGSQVLLPPAMPEGIVGSWSFDEAPVALDASGNGNHGRGSLQAGPSLAGQGSSAFFRRSFLTIPGKGALQLSEFSYTFWVYLIDVRSALPPRRRPAACALLRKGPRGAPAPGILVVHGSRRLRVEISTVADSETPAGIEAFESNARLGLGRWYHLAVVCIGSQRMVHLYVNGILDSSRSTQGFTQAGGPEPLFVGADPSTRLRCDVPLYVDELKAYSRPLVPDEIQAEAAPSLAGIEPSFVRLACLKCPLEIALQNCPDGYHICNPLELHIGGYQVARTLGWLDFDTHVWSHAPSAGAAPQAQTDLGQPPASLSAAPSSSLGLGLCCADGA